MDSASRILKKFFGFPEDFQTAADSARHMHIPEAVRLLDYYNEFALPNQAKNEEIKKCLSAFSYDPRLFSSSMSPRMT